jgi:hypothetical protein
MTDRMRRAAEMFSRLSQSMSANLMRYGSISSGERRECAIMAPRVLVSEIEWNPIIPEPMIASENPGWIYN